MIFDLLVLVVVVYAMYLGYKNGTHVELYRIGRVFLGMTLAGMYGTTLGWKLTSMGILSANDKAILSLIGFLVLFSIYWILTIVIIKVINIFSLHEHKLNNYIGIFANGFIALLFITFLSFMSTQLAFAKDGYKEFLRDSSFSYIHMDRLCRKVITVKVVDHITGDSAGQMAIDNLGIIESK